jgi:integrase
MPPNNDEPFLHEIAPTLFRLIYTCGLRPNEGRELLTSNLNLDNGTVMITHTKMNKERYVVMSDDMLNFARKYDLRRRIFAEGNPYFFPSNNGEAFTGNKILAVLTAVWTIAVSDLQNPVPPRIRVYDLRHRFASACLNRWLDAGYDLMSKLPYLSMFMGHDSYNETAYYIHILPENLIKSPGVNWEIFDKMFPDIEDTMNRCDSTEDCAK